MYLKHNNFVYGLWKFKNLSEQMKNGFIIKNRVLFGKDIDLDRMKVIS